MTSTGDADRESFACWAEDFLRRSGSFLDLREVARIGRLQGVLSPFEAAEIERQNYLPEWLVKQFRSGSVKQATENYADRVIADGQTHLCRAPVQLNQLVLPRDFQRAGGRSPAVHVIEGTNGTFTLQNFLKAGFVSDGYIPPLTDVGGLWSWDIFRDREPCHLAGRTLICVVEGSVIYTHWLFDTIPRFEIARMAGLDPAEFDHIVVAVKHPKFCDETFTVLGIPGSKVRTRAELGPVIHCDDFCYVSAVRLSSFAGDWLFDYIRRLFGPEGQNDALTDRLYISRSRASRRRIINESDLIPILNERGFRILHAEDFGVREMARICSRASHIVGPHGAGMANAVFAPPGAKVLEIYGPHLSLDYWIMSNAMGYKYHILQGVDPMGVALSEARIDQMGFFQRNGLDILLDPHLLEHALEVLLE